MISSKLIWGLSVVGVSLFGLIFYVFSFLEWVKPLWVFTCLSFLNDFLNVLFIYIFKLFLLILRERNIIVRVKHQLGIKLPTFLCTGWRPASWATTARAVSFNFKGKKSLCLFLTLSFSLFLRRTLELCAKSIWLYVPCEILVL